MAKNSEHSIQDFHSEHRNNDDEETLENSYQYFVSSGSLQPGDQTSISVNGSSVIKHRHRQMSHDTSHDSFGDDARPFDLKVSLLSPGPLDTVDEVTEPEDNEEAW